MRKALLLTIGTEITAGEVINSNAAWVSRRLEERGVRVFSHLSVRDQAAEIAHALEWSRGYDLVVVTGGLGPTSDDMTRASMAAFAGLPLEFDEQVWTKLKQLYVERQLPLREAHRHQCWFPRGAKRLANPVGTALGFALEMDGRPYYVLPGPPRELEGIWLSEIEPQLRVPADQTLRRWRRWTCLGAPESEVAELVEPALLGRGIEVGYRAQIPYVKVKIFADPVSEADAIAAVETALAPFIVMRGEGDLAEELLRRWPQDVLHVCDSVTGDLLVARLLAARKALVGQGARAAEISFSRRPDVGVSVRAEGEKFWTTLHLSGGFEPMARTLPYRVKLGSERGQRSAAEWVLWNCVSALRAHPSTSAT